MQAAQLIITPLFYFILGTPTHWGRSQPTVC